MERALLVAAVCTMIVIGAAASAQSAHNAWLAALLAQDVTSWTPAMARKRLAKLGPLERAQPTPQLLILAGGDAQQRVELGCRPNGAHAVADPERSFRCSQVLLRIAAATSAEAERVHGELAEQLRATLGEPRYVRRDDGPLPSIGWQRSRVEVSLSEQAATAGEQSRRLIEITFRNVSR